jgi:transposase-like protein
MGDRWFVDETYVKVAGRWTYLYRAIDQHGQEHCCIERFRDLVAGNCSFGRMAQQSGLPNS